MQGPLNSSPSRLGRDAEHAGDLVIGHVDVEAEHEEKPFVVSQLVEGAT